MKLRISLGWKLALAFAVVLVIALGSVYVFTRQAAQREVQAYMLHGGGSDASRIAAGLVDYYQVHDGWEGVDEYLDGGFSTDGMMGQGHGGQGQGMMGQRFILADEDGRVLYSQGTQSSSRLSSSQRRSAYELTLDGDVIGYLSLGGGLGADERQIIDRLDQALFLSALIGGGAAFVLAAILIVGLLRPVRQLTEAAKHLGSGDLSQRVSITSADEVGDLARSFNDMAGSLEQAERRRRELTAEIAHELRNPLAVMQARIEGLIDGVYPLESDELKPALEQSRLLNRLVDDLRLLALADEGQLTLDVQPVQLSRLVDDIVQAHRPKADQAGVELVVSAEPGMEAQVEADAGRLAQVIGNLLDNAIRYTPHGKKVRVHIERAGSQVLIQVEDEGEGIAPDDLPHVFARFYRADPGRSRRAGGTGLGLAIARKLVEAQGGKITAANIDGGGARFQVSLPALP